MRLWERGDRASLAMRRVAGRIAAAGWVILSISVCAGAQPQLPEPPLPVDPTPIEQLLTSADKTYLAEANNAKKVIEAYLRISDLHLQAALAAIKGNDYRSAERELDIYNKAVAEAGKDAFALQDGKRNAAKKVEQNLYRQIKMLESIHRLFPARREAFSEAALKHAKQLRMRALNEALAAGGGVLKYQEEKKEPDGERPTKQPPKKKPSSNTPPALDVALYRRSSLLPAEKLYTVSVNRGAPVPQVRGDYMTEEEDDHVREAQAADARVKVFMKIADRRIKAITRAGEAPIEKKEQKKVEDEEREWGALPALTRAELLNHYARALAECMAKLDDAYERNPKSSALPKALTTLRDATEKHLQILRSLAAEIKDGAETAALREAIEQAETANKGARDGLK